MKSFYSLYNQNEICLNGKTALYNQDAIEKRKNQLEKLGFSVRLVWECNVMKMLNVNHEMAEFFNQQIHSVGPLIPREGFQVKISN